MGTFPRVPRQLRAAFKKKYPKIAPQGKVPRQFQTLSRSDVHDLDVNATNLHLLTDPCDYHPGQCARLAEPVQERRREAELHDDTVLSCAHY